MVPEAICLTCLLTLISCDTGRKENGAKGGGGKAGPEAPALISDEGRAYIWNAENRANALKEHGFSRMAAAFSGYDVEGLVQFFSPGCRGFLPDRNRGRAFRAGHLAVRFGGTRQLRGGQSHRRASLLRSACWE